MPKKGTTNLNLKKVIDDLKKSKTPLWKRVAKDLSKARRQRISVNLSRINRNSKEGDTIVVPGKVLGDGELKHKLTIAAYWFSSKAENKIKEAGSKAILIPELFRNNPKGKGVKLLG